MVTSDLVGVASGALGATLAAGDAVWVDVEQPTTSAPTATNASVPLTVLFNLQFRLSLKPGPQQRECPPGPHS